MKMVTFPFHLVSVNILCLSTSSTVCGSRNVSKDDYQQLPGTGREHIPHCWVQDLLFSGGEKVQGFLLLVRQRGVAVCTKNTKYKTDNYFSGVSKVPTKPSSNEDPIIRHCRMIGSFGRHVLIHCMSTCTWTSTRCFEGPKYNTKLSLQGGRMERKDDWKKGKPIRKTFI